MLKIIKLKKGNDSLAYYRKLIRYLRGRKPPPDKPPGFSPSDDGLPEPLEPYSIPGEPPAYWLGGAREYFHIYGEVQDEHLEALWQGLDPIYRTPLLQNSGQKQRQPGWDLTFSAPKAVDVLWATADPELRQIIEDIDRRAIEYTITAMEEELPLSRMGKAGAIPTRGKLLAACHPHHISRRGDPKLHTHVIIPNLVVCPDGNVRALHTRPLFEYQRVYGAMYRLKLGSLLERELRLLIKRNGCAFTIEGIPESLLTTMSKGSKEIAAWIEAAGVAGGKAKQRANLETRGRKEGLPNYPELFPIWRAQASEHGLTPAKAKKLVGKRKRQTISEKQQRKKLGKLIARTFDEVEATYPHFTLPQFISIAIEEGQATGIDPDEIRNKIKQTIRSSPKLIPLKPIKNRQRFTTPAVLAEETELLTTTKKLEEREGVRVRAKTLRKVLAKPKHKQLSQEQLKAVERLTKEPSALRLLPGLAGTGKTQVISALVDAYQAEGINIRLVTPTGKAKEVLQSRTGVRDAQTATRALLDFEMPYRWHDFQTDVNGIARSIKTGKRFTRPKKPTKVKVNPRTLVIIDEAGMLGTRQTKMLAQHVEEHGGTIILAGDMQLPPVAGTTPFPSLCKRQKVKPLRDIRRQEKPWHRKAIKELANARALQAITILQDKDRLHVEESLDDAVNAAVSQWVADGNVDTPQQAAIIANTNREVDLANKKCQQIRIKARQLKPYTARPITYIDEHGAAQKAKAHIGEQVVITKNSSRYRVANGQVGTVEGFVWEAIKPEVRVEHARIRLHGSGELVDVPLDNYFPHLRLSYARTTYASQGESIPRVYVIAAGALQDNLSTYVQVSRGIKDCHVFTTKELFPDRKNLKNSELVRIANERPDQTLASDHKPDFADPDREKVIRQALTKYLREYVKHGPGASIIVPDERTAEELSQQAQAILVANSKKKSEPLPRLRLNGIHLHPGDRIRFTEDGLSGRISKGGLAVVKEVLPSQNRIKVQPDRGSAFVIPLKEFPHIKLGFAITQEHAVSESLKLKQAIHVSIQQEFPQPTGTQYSLKNLQGMSKDKQLVAVLRPALRDYLKDYEKLGSRTALVVEDPALAREVNKQIASIRHPGDRSRRFAVGDRFKVAALPKTNRQPQLRKNATGVISESLGPLTYRAVLDDGTTIEFETNHMGLCLDPAYVLTKREAQALPADKLKNLQSIFVDETKDDSGKQRFTATRVVIPRHAFSTCTV